MRDATILSFRNVIHEAREELGEHGNHREFALAEPPQRVVLYGLLTESDAIELHRRKMLLARRRFASRITTGRRTAIRLAS